MTSSSFQILIAPDELEDRLRTFPLEWHALIRYDGSTQNVRIPRDAINQEVLARPSKIIANVNPFKDEYLNDYDRAALYGSVNMSSPGYTTAWAWPFEIGFKWDEVLPNKVSADVFKRNQAFYKKLKRYLLALSKGIVKARDGSRIPRLYFTEGAQRLVREGYTFYLYGSEPNPLSDYVKAPPPELILQDT